MRYVATINEKEYTIDVIDEHHVAIDGRVLEVEFESVSGQPVFSLLIDGQSHEAYVYPEEEQWQVLLRGRLYSTAVEDEREKRLRSALGGVVAESGEYHMKAPMPGLVVSVQVEVGQQVEKGQVLVILESMKMQNELKAPRAGTIQRIRVQNGERVEQKQTLLSMA